MALADALGNLTGCRRLPGLAHDLRGTAAPIEGLTRGQFLADRALDANRLRAALTDAGTEAVIPPGSNRRFPAGFDRGRPTIAAWKCLMRHPSRPRRGRCKGSAPARDIQDRSGDTASHIRQ